MAIPDQDKGLGIAALLATGIFSFLIYFAPQYGYTGDELYFLDCARHPAWGYVDLPPLVPWLGWLVLHTLGASLYAIRFLPALAASATVFLTALLARELGGERTAIVSSAVLAAAAPIVLTTGHLFMTTVFDLSLWLGLVLVLVRIAKGGDGRLWLAFGGLAGLALLNKYVIAFFLASLVVGCLATSWRRWFLGGWFWAAVLVAAVIVLPNFLWQASRDFPFLQLMHNIRANGRDVALPPLQFLLVQAVMVNPFSFAYVFAGAVFFFTSAGRRFRGLGWAYLAFTALLMALHAKNYYLGPVYPMMFAAGAVAAERWCSAAWARRAVAVYTALPVVTSCVFLPFIVPVLPIERFVAFQQALRFRTPESEHHERSVLPDLYADMYGLPETARLVASYYHALPLEERRETAIYAGHFAEAGAIDLFGPALGLPAAISGHQNYWLWGPRGYSGESVIVVGPCISREYLESDCASLSVAAERHNPFARPDRNSPIYHCRGLKYDLRTGWARLRHWD